MRIKYIFPFLFAIQMVQAQSSALGNWVMYFGNADLGNSWNWHHEIQWRSYDVFPDLEQLLIRTGIGRDLTPGNNNLLLGYGYIHGQSYTNGAEDKLKSNEHRIYQQFITRQQFGRVHLQHRYRFEQRFLEDDFRVRWRYFLGLNLPVNRSVMGKGAIYLSAYNELFINGDGPLFDRNRIYGALGYQFARKARIEAGLMSQVYRRSNRPQVQVAIFNTISFKSEARD